MLPRRDRRADVRAAVHRWRDRQRKCQAVASVAYDGRVLNMLVRRRYIGEAEVGDALEVSKAISLFLADHAAIDDP